MSVLIDRDIETLEPSESDANLARESSQRLAKSKLGPQSNVRIQILGDGQDGEIISVPASAIRLLQRILVEMSHGNAVSVIPTQAELTTQQAADLLNVSRPFLIKLLDNGQLPYRTVGEFRRVRFDDLMAYKQKDDTARAAVLAQLTAEAQELEMGY